MTSSNAVSFEHLSDAYPNWLAQRKTNTGKTTVSGGNSQRQRRQLIAWVNQLNRIENDLSRFTTAREAFALKLTDNATYDAGNRDMLATTLADQAAVQQRIEHAEDEWMRLGESIEAMR